MKLLCSVGNGRRAAPLPHPTKYKPSPPFLELKKNELNNISNITISVGYFYFDVLMFLCVLFYCTEI